MSSVQNVPDQKPLTPMALADLRQQAHKTFLELKAIFQGNYNNYWILGHSFDTIIDYLVSYPPDSPGFGEIAKAAYTRSNGNWYDDFGWWGIAALRASQHPELFDNDAFFKQVSVSCWTQMHDNAPFVWERADQIKYAELRPFLKGGVWNSDFKNCKPADSLCGIQNTVTNSVYLVLASRRYLAGQDSRGPAELEFLFLRDWLLNVPPPVDTLLYQYSSGGLAVVRERVTAYASQKPARGYCPKFAWAGDQGLVLGGLVDRMKIIGSGDPYYGVLLNLAKLILHGSTDYLANGGGILQSWRPDPPPGNDSGDYMTGVGAFMRYFLYAYLNNGDLRSYLTEPYFTNFIVRNATQVLAHPSLPDYIVTLTNDLATLVTAIVTLYGQE